jgi:flavin-dependent dehydrogenase
VSRFHLDHLLFRSAVAAGAQPHQATVPSVTAVPAQVVVGAWGRWGRFDTELQRGFVRDRLHRNFGFKRHYRDSGGRRAAGSGRGEVQLYSFDRGYLGVSPIEDQQTNICGLVHASRLAGHKGRWEAFVEEIRSKEPQLEAMYSQFEPAQEEFLSSDPVIFHARSAVEHGIFMIGDASGVIDPLTGNGMAMAIQSALLAAPFVMEAVSGKRDRAERQYRQRHHDFFASRIAWSRRVAFLLSRPMLLDAALACRPSRAIGEFLLRRTRSDRDVVDRLAEEWFS